MLPAAYTGPEDFVREGFATAVRARGIDLDLQFAAPAPAHLTDQSLAEELHRELILPARALGCALWLGGISLGGFIALRCAAQYPAGHRGTVSVRSLSRQPHHDGRDRARARRARLGARRNR